MPVGCESCDVRPNIGCCKDRGKSSCPDDPEEWCSSDTDANSGVGDRRKRSTWLDNEGISADTQVVSVVIKLLSAMPDIRSSW